MHEILIDVKNKIAKTTDPDHQVVVCGNSDYIIRFTFDDEWQAFSAKTARFSYGAKHQDIVFTGDECKVPVLNGIHHFTIGVFAGDLHTTTPATVYAKKSILCEDGVPEEPAPDVYGQIMEKVDEACKASDSAVQKAGEYAVNADASAKAAFDSAKSANDAADAARGSADTAKASEDEARKESVKAAESADAAAASHMAAQAVLDSIPDDYTQMVSDVNQLKDELSEKVDFSKPQSLTAQQQTQAQSNIGIHKVTQGEYDALTDTSGIYIIMEE